MLIALAIISIAMTAIIKSTTQHIRSTSYLQTKTIAMWVGTQVLNEARLGLLALPMDSNKLKSSTAMLGRDWYWQVAKMSTPNKQIDKVSVEVYEHDNEDEEVAPLISLESFIYHDAEK